MLPGFGFVILCCMVLGVIFINYKSENLDLKFKAIKFSCGLLPPIVLSAGMIVDLNRFVANWRVIVFRGIIIPLISFVFVSTGALICLPKLDIESITARDCLVIGSLFASTNFLFCFEDIRIGRENIRYLYELTVGESIFNTATSFVLFKMVQSVDVTPLQPSTTVYLVAQFAYVVLASMFLGFVVAIYHQMLVVSIVVFGDPERDFFAEGALRMKQSFQVTIIQVSQMIFSYALYMLAEVYELNHVLVIFSYSILTSHQLLPKSEGFKVTFRHDAPMIVNYIESHLYIWFAMSVANSDHWGYVFRSRVTFGTYFAATFILLILLLVGRVPSMLHFSRSVMINVGETRKAYLLNRWSIGNIELENKVIIWWSGFMPSIFAAVLALEQFDKSEEPRHALMLTSICTVVCLTSVIYCIFMASPLKQWLVRLMITTSSDTAAAIPPMHDHIE